MTCIVGLRTDEGVWVGGDSAGLAGWSRTIRADAKVFALEERMLFGFTDSFRMGQLLRYELALPRRHPGDDLMEYMVVDFIAAVRTCLKDGGYARDKSGEEAGGTFIVATEGRIFRVDSDYQVGEPVAPYTAVGCGYDLALGALHATRDISGLTPEDRVRMALEAAAEHSAGVAPPFVTLALPGGVTL